MSADPNEHPASFDQTHDPRSHPDAWKPPSGEVQKKADFKDIKVDLGSLGAFGDKIIGEVDQNVRTPYASLVKLYKELNLEFGQHAKGFSFQEGQYFDEVQRNAMKAVAEFMKDMMRGLTILGAAAGSIAAAYMGTDAAAAATLDDVNKVFTADPSAPKGAEQKLPEDVQVDESKYEAKDEPDADKPKERDGKGYWINGKEGDPDAYYVEGDNEGTRDVPKTDKDPVHAGDGVG